MAIYQIEAGSLISFSQNLWVTTFLFWLEKAESHIGKVQLTVGIFAYGNAQRGTAGNLTSLAELT
jgi:hypothetical protein